MGPAAARAVLAVSFLNLAVSQGIHQSFPLFYVSMLDDLGWSRAATAGVFSLSMLIIGSSGPLVGYGLQALGARRWLAAGVLALAAGLAATARIASGPGLYWTYGVLAAVGLAALGWSVHGAVLTSWFRHHRGTVTAVAFSGQGLGAMAMAPVVQWLIQSLGWRGALMALSGLVAALIVPNVGLMRDPPRSQAAPEPGQPATGPWQALKHALGTGAFWYGFSAFFFVALGMFSMVPHQAAFLVDSGFSPAVAATAVAAVGFLSFSGRLLFGWVSDRWGHVTSAAASSVLSALGAAAMLVMTFRPHGALVALYALCFGLGFGSRAPVLASLAAEKFSGPNFGVIFGAMTLGHGMGGSVGPWIAGWLFDVTGTYRWVFAYAVFTALFSIRLISAAERSPGFAGLRVAGLDPAQDGPGR
ncbi:MAG: MFS transporter [Firmicutes bacterium]|nr:MFS transporter [Bacillota bacterium]